MQSQIARKPSIYQASRTFCKTMQNYEKARFQFTKQLLYH